MPGNRKALEAGTIVSRKGMFRVVNKINFFSPGKCGAMKMWLHDKQMKPFEKLWTLYNSIQTSWLAAGQAHFRRHVWRYICI